MRNNLLFILLLFSVLASGQKHNPGYSTVPTGLDKNANAIVRYYNKDIERVSDDQIKTNVSMAITVLNKNGESAGLFHLSYTDEKKVAKVSGAIYGAEGQLINQIKKKDFSDFSNFADFVFYSDSRSMVYSPKVTKYPYTVEYSYSTVTTGIIHIDLWQPVEGYGIAVAEATLRYTTPKKMTFKHVAQNHEFETRKAELNPETWQYEWKVQNFGALKREPYSPDFQSIFPYISLSPVHFNYNGYSGEYTNWNGYGNWVKSLIEETTVLPEETINRIKVMTDTLPSTREKIKAVYQHMQRKTRYVCISVGIEGFKPMQAADVDKYGYGDCKALSNYTRALLTAIGIPSYYTEIGADTRRIRFTDIASVDQTNHAILAVPFDNDTIWLECTNPYNPFGYVGSAIANRKALLVGEKGGELVEMPDFGTADNVLNKRLNLKIDENGNATADYTIKASGLVFEDYGFLGVATAKIQKDYLLTNIPINNLTINDFNLINDGDENPTALLTIHLNAGNYASRAGDRLFVPLNHLSPIKIKLPTTTDRTFDVHFEYPQTEESDFHYEIPDTFEVEHLPEAQNLENKYISYHSSCEMRDNKVVFTRKFSIHTNIIPREDYKELQETLEQIKQKDNAKLVLKRKA